MSVVTCCKARFRAFGFRNILMLSAVFALGASTGLAPLSSAQFSVTTQKYDNSRSGLNLQEHILTLANVNKTTFGKLFIQPVDGGIVGQPLFVSNVNVTGMGKHNVVFVATMHDSVYAFDAQNADGTNAAPLWHVNFTNSGAGITSVPIADQTCGNVTAFKEIGIESAMVIDPVSSTIYVVAKTEENGAFVHKLHALSAADGTEKFGGPVKIQASVIVGGVSVPFVDKFEMSRPGLALANGNVYLSFGSLGCKNSINASGWLMAYNAKTLAQTGVFATNPNNGYGSSIWQAGVGPAIDSSGNIYFATADGPLNASQNGAGYGDSVVKLNGSAAFLDYFAPYNEDNLDLFDLDLGSGGVLLLPDQLGAHPHELIAAGKEGSIYVVDRDNLGGFETTGNPNLPQFLPMATGVVNGLPVYWSNLLFIAGKTFPVQAYSLVNGALSATPIFTSTRTFSNPNGLQITANGSNNAILWLMEGRGADAKLFSFNATTLEQLYSTADMAPRDGVGGAPHFATATVAQGRVYVGGTSNLNIYGLFRTLAVSAGDNQSGTAGTTLPVALKVKAQDPYGRGVSGFQVTFTDNKGGIFNPATATTDGSGYATTSYTLSQTPGTATISATSTVFGKVTLTETSLAGAPTSIKTHGGFNQTAPVNTVLPAPVSAAVKDALNNGVPNVSVTFDDGGVGGVFTPSSVVTTDSSGYANVNYTTPPTAQVVFINARVSGISTPATFKETVTAP